MDSKNLDTMIGRLASAITPVASLPGHDATGGSVGSLTEAVMGMTAALVQIAEAIEELADATRNQNARG